eukprot:Gb_03201 [translate_table: standard]
MGICFSKRDALKEEENSFRPDKSRISFGIAMECSPEAVGLKDMDSCKQFVDELGAKLVEIEERHEITSSNGQSRSKANVILKDRGLNPIVMKGETGIFIAEKFEAQEDDQSGMENMSWDTADNTFIIYSNSAEATSDISCDSKISPAMAARSYSADMRLKVGSHSDRFGDRISKSSNKEFVGPWSGCSRKSSVVPQPAHIPMQERVRQQSILPREGGGQNIIEFDQKKSSFGSGIVCENPKKSCEINFSIRNSVDIERSARFSNLLDQSLCKGMPHMSTRNGSKDRIPNAQKAKSPRTKVIGLLMKSMSLRSKTTISPNDPKFSDKRSSSCRGCDSMKHYKKSQEVKELDRQNLVFPRLNAVSDSKSLYPMHPTEEIRSSTKRSEACPMDLLDAIRANNTKLASNSLDAAGNLVNFRESMTLEDHLNINNSISNNGLNRSSDSKESIDFESGSQQLEGLCRSSSPSIAGGEAFGSPFSIDVCSDADFRGATELIQRLHSYSQERQQKAALATRRKHEPLWGNDSHGYFTEELSQGRVSNGTMPSMTSRAVMVEYGVDSEDAYSDSSSDLFDLEFDHSSGMWSQVPCLLSMIGGGHTVEAPIPLIPCVISRQYQVESPHQIMNYKQFQTTPSSKSKKIHAKKRKWPRFIKAYSRMIKVKGNSNSNFVNFE